jgi:hypothetical protein
MILQPADLSPSQKSAIEASMGSTVEAPESAVVLGAKTYGVSDDLRLAATDQMRHRLSVLDRSQRRMSIEEIASEMLERPQDNLSD